MNEATERAQLLKSESDKADDYAQEFIRPAGGPTPEELLREKCRLNSVLLHRIMLASNSSYCRRDEVWSIFGGRSYSRHNTRRPGWNV